MEKALINSHYSFSQLVLLAMIFCTNPELNLLLSLQNLTLDAIDERIRTLRHSLSKGFAS